MNIVNTFEEYTQQILEMNFQNRDYIKHTYVLDVIQALLDGKELKLGKQGKDGTVSLKDFDKNKLISLQKEVINREFNVDKFNDCFLNKKLKWSSLYKGDFSNYQNNGMDFEKLYANTETFNKVYRKDIEKLVGPLGDVEVQYDGGMNQKRSLELSGNYLILSSRNGKDNYIGPVVTDVTVMGGNLGKDGKLYLSLKDGKKVTFNNSGVNNPECFQKTCFTSNKPFGPVGQKLLEVFGINDYLFRQIFNSFIDKNCVVTKEDIEKALKEQGIKNGYSISSSADTLDVDVTNFIQKNLIEKYLAYVIGFGYILVHQIGNNIHLYDLRTESDMEEMIKFDSLKLKYHFNGSAKRLDMFAQFNKVDVLFNIRAKDGGVYPTHIMSDYILK